MKPKFLICEKCGSVLTFLTGDGDDVNCCGEKMKELHVADIDGAKEKHVPQVNKIEGAVRVDVGEISHPMEGDHYIEWIYLQTRRGVQFVRLKDGEEPRATFGVSGEAPGDKAIAVYAYCNKHGLWKTQLSE